LKNVVTGDVSTEGTNISSNATADMTNTVGGKLVNNVTGNMENTVGGDLKNVVTGDVSTEGTNISSNATADMTNTVGGKLVNNVTGNMENTVGGDLKNVVTGDVSTEGKNITNQAEESIVDKVGGNVSRTMTGKKIIESVANGNESNVSTRTAKKAMSVVSDGTNTTTVSQLSNGYNVSLKAVDASGNTTKSLTDKKTVDEDVTKMADAASGAFSSRSQKTSSIVDIVKGADGTTNTVSNETSGTTFENSAHNTPVGEGTITRTNIAGNTVETGSVTMDYAEVRKNLGVHGNAVIDGNTTVGGALGVTGKATFHDDVDIAKNLNVAGNASVTGDVTAASFKVGNETYISAEGINANNKKITNVAPGELSPTSMDAVNGSQLYNTNQRVSKLDSRLDKVGANAAALANLNPLEFDKDSKLNVAAAVGNYRDETAAAIGMYYRPNEDVMLGVSTSFGTGENMVGGGISVRVGRGGNKSARAATENAIKENEILRQEVKELEARMDALLSVLNPNMSKEFPDVPANHWAYEAVSRLAGNGIIEGYEDGKYHGERQMTRYEMAEIIYKALSKGVKAEKELIDEFRPELQAMTASNKA
ncbi:MAG: S-layer protein, partial [Veillonellaceae bacterium]